MHNQPSMNNIGGPVQLASATAPRHRIRPVKAGLQPLRTAVCRRPSAGYTGLTDLRTAAEVPLYADFSVFGDAGLRLRECPVGLIPPRATIAGVGIAVKPQQEPCLERQRLAERFADATRGYSDAVAKLAQHRGITTELRYRQLRMDVDDARTASEAAALALERHISMHGC